MLIRVVAVDTEIENKLKKITIGNVNILQAGKQCKRNRRDIVEIPCIHEKVAT